MVVPPGSGSLMKTFSQGPIDCDLPTSHLRDPTELGLVLRGSEDRAACAGSDRGEYEGGCASALSSTKTPSKLLCPENMGSLFVLAP